MVRLFIFAPLHVAQDQKAKQDDNSNYFVSHDKPECDPNKGIHAQCIVVHYCRVFAVLDSIFTSKFVPSASFNNLIACIKNTRLSQHQYVMANVTSKHSPGFVKVDEKPTPSKHGK